MGKRKETEIKTHKEFLINILAPGHVSRSPLYKLATAHYDYYIQRQQQYKIHA